MTDMIATGSLLVAGGTQVPESLLLRNEPDSNGWAAIKGARATFEKTIRDAGWTFFFMAGEIKATAFGFDKQKTLGIALQRLLADVKSQHCNSIEITQVIHKKVLNVPYVSVFAHVRHLQKGLRFSG